MKVNNNSIFYSKINFNIIALKLRYFFDIIVYNFLEQNLLYIFINMEIDIIGKIIIINITTGMDLI